MGDSASNEPWLAPGSNFFSHFKHAQRLAYVRHVEPEEQTTTSLCSTGYTEEFPYKAMSRTAPYMDDLSVVISCQ